MIVSKIGSMTLFAGALVFSGMIATQAAASSVGFSGLWTESDTGANPASNTLSFTNLATLFADGEFAGYEAVEVKDLNLISTDSSNDGVSALTAYAIDGNSFDGIAWKTYENQAGDIITFNLDLDATWLRTLDISDGDRNYEQGPNSNGVFEYTGTYILSDGSMLAGRGQLNASAAGAAMTFEITQTAVVPLPAAAWLLGGGVAMLGAMRRRKTAA